MNKYISFGGGVNSTAMIIHMINTGWHFDEIVFADTGAEWPETYEYVDYFDTHYLKQYGKTISRISAKSMGTETFDSLLDFYKYYSMVPSRLMRSCTAQFKIKPIFAYYDKPCIQYLGIDAGEAHRAKPSRDKNIESQFPLIDAGITRKMCVDIIKCAGLCIPRKSGCYFCAFSRISQLKELFELHPNLFENIIRLEKAHAEKHSAEYFIKDKPMTELAERFKVETDAEEMQLDLWDDSQDAMNCMCKFG